MLANSKRFNGLSSILVLVLLFTAALYGAPRSTLSLDGVWRMADSVDGDRIPAAFSHTAPVPGLANLATPPFPDVDRFDSREFIANQIRNKLLPESARTTAVGVPRQQRDWFWYERTFRAPARREVAVLKINKAQFGTAVWLNGKKIGEYTGCFTASYFDVTAAINWLGENRLVVRIGAHPAVLPPTVMPGIDQEKVKWTPGIYDSVSLFFSDNPFIERIQVAPRLATSEIVIQTVVHNRSAKPVSFALTHTVREWKSGAAAGRGTPRRMTIAAGERQAVTDRVAIPGPSLWAPERPFLYVLDSSTGGDSASTRFGMREFRFDTATRRAYLNGSVYFLRGSNITLHRFFEDPKAGALPWNELLRNLGQQLANPLLQTNAYLLAGLTEYWRAHRIYAGVLHFVYLMSSYPGVYTSDHFRDIEKLELEPNFVDYVGESFKPLGVYIDFWRPSLEARAARRIRVMMVNDTPETRSGKLTLRLVPRKGGNAVFSQETAFEIGPSGQHSFAFNVSVPDVTGDFVLCASASSGVGETTSRRFVKLTSNQAR